MNITKCLALALALTVTAAAHAQFEQGKKYINTSLTSGGLSYSSHEDFRIGFSAQAGYMYEPGWMVLGEAGVDYQQKDWQSVYAGAKCRYYIEENGIFVSGGVRLLHAFKNHNDFQITPELGYCFFLGKNVTIEPVAYYDISLSDCHYSKLGLKVGLGFYF